MCDLPRSASGWGVDATLGKAMLLRRLLLSAVSLAVALLAAEFWFSSRVSGTGDGIESLSTFEPSSEQLARWEKRLKRLRRIESGVGTQKSAPMIQFSERYGWALASGAEGVLNGDQISLNAIGARRSAEVGEQPPAGVLRVACYGESFTFGSEVDNGEDWPAQLEDTGAGALEVLNLGVIGWGTDQALLRFRDGHAQLNSDVVLMGLMSENIQRNVNRLVSVRAPKEFVPLVKPRFLLDNGELRLLPQPYASEIDLYEAAVNGKLGHDLASHEWLAESSEGAGWSNVADAVRAKREREERARWWLQWKEPDGEPFRVTVALLEAFHREALEAGARMAGVVVFCSILDISDQDRELTALHAALDQRGIPYVDLYDVLRARHARGDGVYGRTHLTAGANREVASTVFEWLKQELDL